MEINSDFIMLQGIVNNCVKKTGDFTRINYTGGNEQNILYILEEITKFLTEKGYLKDFKPSSGHSQQLDDIVLFLAINTIFKRDLGLDEYVHLKEIIPKLSKCLLANICYGLDLLPQYGNVILKFPLNAAHELIDQMIDCLRKAKPKEQLEKAFIILEAVVTKLSVTELSNQSEEDVGDIVQSCNEMLRYLTGVGAEYAEKMKKIEIFKHMGYTLLHFFDLLLKIDEKQPIMKGMLECLLATCSNIFSTVSVNVYCAWAEVRHDDQPLQIIIAGKAYLFIEKYQKFELAKQLISMLSTIAVKPKSLHQIIIEADVPTIIQKAGTDGPHQYLWFQAMLNLQLFQYKDAVKVLEENCHLCNDKDIARLLELNITEDVEKNQQIILKSASQLSETALETVMVRNFHQRGFLWHRDIQNQLTETFNKLVSESDENVRKEVLLLLLQNVPLFFQHLFNSIFKGSQVIPAVREVCSKVALIDNVALDTLQTILKENELNEQNINGYLKLFSAFIDFGFCEQALKDVLLSNMKSFFDENKLECLKCCLEIFEVTLDKIYLNPTNTLMKGFLQVSLLQFLVDCYGYMRCKTFLDFSFLKTEIAALSAAILLKPYMILNPVVQSNAKNIDAGLHDPWITYYLKTLVSGTEVNMLELVLPNLNLRNYESGTADENFTSLMKMLPCCTSTEWSTIINQLKEGYGYKIMMNVITDILILLCEFCQSQNLPNEQVEKLIPPLKHCLQNYGKTFKTISFQSTDDQTLAINNLCRVLKHIPTMLKLTEGIALIQMIPDEPLKSMSKDKEFVKKIILIGDKQLCKILAQKVLASSS